MTPAEIKAILERDEPTKEFLKDMNGLKALVRKRRQMPGSPHLYHLMGWLCYQKGIRDTLAVVERLRAENEKLKRYGNSEKNTDKLGNFEGLEDDED